jgi:hypothetical protein
LSGPRASQEAADDQAQQITSTVTCAKPGAPATGKQAPNCHELLNVSGVLSDVRE